MERLEPIDTEQTATGRRIAAFAMSLRTRSRLAAMLTTLVLLMLWAHPVLAHGGGRTLHVDQAPAGSFYLSVWTSPEIRRTGDIHVEAMVLDAQGNIDTNCLVRVSVIPLDHDGPAWTVPAAPTGDQREVEAAIRVEQPGRYAFAVEVIDAAGARGTVHFETNIIAVPAFVRLLIFGLLAASGVIGLWLVRAGSGVWRPAYTSSAYPAG